MPGQSSDRMVALHRPKMLMQPTYTADELLKRVRMSDRQASRFIAFESKKRLTPPVQMPDWSAWKVRMLNKDNQHVHTVHIFSPDQKVTRDSLVVVNCNCPRMVYFYEYANAHKSGSSFIYRCNGERPTKTNPGLRIGLCKHAYLALSRIAVRVAI